MFKNTLELVRNLMQIMHTTNFLCASTSSLVQDQ